MNHLAIAALLLSSMPVYGNVCYWYSPRQAGYNRKHEHVSPRVEWTNGRRIRYTERTSANGGACKRPAGFRDYQLVFSAENGGAK